MSSTTKSFTSSKTVRFNSILLVVGLAVLIFTEHKETGSAIVMVALGNMKLREVTREPVQPIKIGGNK